MAPITATFADDDADLNANGIVPFKHNLENNFVGPVLASCALVLEGRDDDDYNDNNVATDHTDEETSGEADERKVGKRQSKLFVDEDEINGVVDLSSVKDVSAPPPSAFASRGLSLMPSSPPSPDSLASFENVDIGNSQPFVDDFAVSIISQIDADEELARQLQKEENTYKWKKSKQAKPKVVASFADSLFGAPLPGELKSSYTKVPKENTNSNIGSEYSASFAGGMSMLTKSFKTWGSGLTAAATDFFGEDIQMQPRHISNTESESQYRNAV